MTRIGDWIAWAFSRLVLGFLILFVIAVLVAPVVVLIWRDLFN